MGEHLVKSTLLTIPKQEENEHNLQQLLGLQFITTAHFHLFIFLPQFRAIFLETGGITKPYVPNAQGSINNV